MNIQKRRAGTWGRSPQVSSRLRVFRWLCVRDCSFALGVTFANFCEHIYILYIYTASVAYKSRRPAARVLILRPMRSTCRARRYFTPVVTGSTGVKENPRDWSTLVHYQHLLRASVARKLSARAALSRDMYFVCTRAGYILMMEQLLVSRSQKIFFGISSMGKRVILGRTDGFAAL